jgi:mannose-1-phosphate guanylyltransferase/mannose-6-phosphate isomerase
MLAETLQRVNGPGFAAPLIICAEEHRFIVAELLREIGLPANRIMLEPEPRNTAPAAAVAALAALQDHADALVLLLPSDHVIANEAEFRRVVALAAPVARDGYLVTFGISPTRPETGYGYIRLGEPLSADGAVHRVHQFVEKPDLETAAAYLADGRYAWNSGIFLFRAQSFLAELATFQPAVLAAARAAFEQASHDLDFCRLDSKAFTASPSISVDHAVMEHTRQAAVCPVDMGWSDVGSWDSLWEIAARDDDGNCMLGDVLAIDTKDSYIRSDQGRLTVTIGLDEVVVVATEDAVLVAARDRTQDVKKVVDALKTAQRHERLHHSTVYRPWGNYRMAIGGDRFQVKQITVNPGAQLSLQYHYHRAEHWVVVEGTARVTSGDKVFLLRENESTFLPVGTLHRLENPGQIPLRVIEVQSGAFLGESDIVRIQDNYGRVES